MGQPQPPAAGAGTGVGPHRSAEKQRPGLGRVAGMRRGRCGYCRSQVCDLQMKAMQPETSSFLPPSTSSIFDL